MRDERIGLNPRRSSAIHHLAKKKMRRLTPRQIQILYLHSQGKEKSEIGQVLGISDATVENSQQLIKLRLKVKAIEEAIDIIKLVPAESSRVARGPASKTVKFTHKHLLGIVDLSKDDVIYLVDRAEEWAGFNRLPKRREDRLGGITQFNCFFESSTRTLLSFEIAGKRLGAQVVNLNVAHSSMNKGETVSDTAQTINAMRPDVVVVRHAEAGMARRMTDFFDCAVINGGDGDNEHPTQALVDALTIRQRKGRIAGLCVAICGDIRHSRVARSNILALRMLGANVRVIGPPQLLPDPDEWRGLEVFTDLDEGIRGADVVMMLRMQRERMASEVSVLFGRDYFHEYGLTRARLNTHAPDAVVMHPGPMNRGVEIDDELADDRSRSAILDQVENGVAVRMACLVALTDNLT